MNTTHKYTDASEHGFTLMEVMVVVAIVGIMSMIAIPSYLSWKPGYVSRGAVSLVQRELNKCKMRALETRRQCRVVFTQNDFQVFDGNQARGSSQWGKIVTGGTFVAGSPIKIEKFAKYPNISIINGDSTFITASSKPTVTFSPVGTASNDDVIVRYNNDEKAKISVNIIGRVDVTWR